MGSAGTSRQLNGAGFIRNGGSSIVRVTMIARVTQASVPNIPETQPRVVA